MQFFPFTASQQVSRVEAAMASAKDNASAKGDAFSEVFDKKVGEVRGLFNAGNEENAELMWHKAQAGVQTVKGLHGSLKSKGEAVAEKAAAVLGDEISGAMTKAQVAFRAAVARLQGKAHDASALDSLGKLKMGREDVAALKESLREYGLSEQQIGELLEKVSSESGYSWGQFISAMSDKINGGNMFSAKLSDVETRELKAFFQKLGFTPQEAAGLMDKLAAGKFTTVWNELDAQLAKNPGATVEVSASGLAALGKAMKLSDKAAAQLKALLGGKESLELSPEALKVVVASLKSEIAADRKVATDADRKLMDAVNKALANAVTRAENAQSADFGTTDDARVMRLLGEESKRERENEELQAEARRTGSSKGSGATDSVDPKADVNKGDKDGKAAAATADAVKGEGRGASTAKAEGEREHLNRISAYGDSKSGRYGGKEESFGDSATGDGKGGSPEDSAGSGKGKDVWDSILDKVKVDRSFDNVVPQAAQAANSARQSAAEAVAAKFGDQAPARFMKQVQDGVLSNLGQGRRRLVLQIDPPELGKLNLVLQVKNNEVTAMFRTETQDAGRMLSEQFAQLRQHLEQQGLKVARMEVQTQLRDSAGEQQWQGAQQHNQAREQREFSQRSGLLRMLRGEDADMAHEMQLDTATARIAHEGLDIIA